MDRASPPVMAFTTSFRDLEVWQESMALVEEIYTLSKSFPRDELFGLTRNCGKQRYQSRPISVREHDGRNDA